MVLTPKIALGVAAALLLYCLLAFARNQHRFTEGPNYGLTFDTRTGQWCNGFANERADVPRCADLARRW